jgi:arginyl-tRNA synthetase
MTMFGRSLAARYLQALGRVADSERTIDEDVDDDEAHVPEGGYQGAYVAELAAEIVASDGDAYVSLPYDDLVARMSEIGRGRMIAHQREVLERIGVRFDVWFSETSLHENGEVRQGIDALREHGHTYESGGALWLRTTDFGDDKDRVLLRASGQPTYFAADVAYFRDKRARGFDRLIYLWGADHHGYVSRVRAAIRCLDEDVDRVEFLIGQLVNLYRGGEPVRMSRRRGEYVTFEELLDEVGPDATRYTFLRQGIDTAVDFDIEHAISRSQDNPVYYVQYAHARIASIIAYAADQGATLTDDVSLERLGHASEMALIRQIDRLPEAVTLAARYRAPHRLTRYAEDLAALFHAFYRDCRVVTEDAELTQARLHLCRAARIALANLLRLLGVSAPERM